MEERYIEDSVKNRLILSGLRELEERGIRDFSLRRVAVDAQVSCAAPYRHFKDKEELILAVISYVREGWSLLAGQICSVYSGDVAGRIVQLAASAVRFWIANGSFRSALMAGRGEFDELRRVEMSRFDAPIVEAVEEYAEGRGEEYASFLRFSVLSTIYGTVALIFDGTETVDTALASLKRRIERDLCCKG